MFLSSNGIKIGVYNSHHPPPLRLCSRGNNQCRTFHDTASRCTPIPQSHNMVSCNIHDACHGRLLHHPRPQSLRHGPLPPTVRQQIAKRNVRNQCELAECACQWWTGRTNPRSFCYGDRGRADWVSAYAHAGANGYEYLHFSYVLRDKQRSVIGGAVSVGNAMGYVSVHFYSLCSGCLSRSAEGVFDNVRMGSIPFDTGGEHY